MAEAEPGSPRSQDTGTYTRAALVDGRDPDVHGEAKHATDLVQEEGISRQWSATENRHDAPGWAQAVMQG